MRGSSLSCKIKVGEEAPAALECPGAGRSQRRGPTWIMVLKSSWLWTTCRGLCGTRLSCLPPVAGSGLGTCFQEGTGVVGWAEKPGRTERCGCSWSDLFRQISNWIICVELGLASIRSTWSRLPLERTLGEGTGRAGDILGRHIAATDMNTPRQTRASTVRGQGIAACVRHAGTMNSVTGWRRTTRQFITEANEPITSADVDVNDARRPIVAWSEADAQSYASIVGSRSRTMPTGAVESATSVFAEGSPKHQATTVKRCHRCGWWIATGQETVNPRGFR